MGKFELELPTEIMNDIQKIYDNSDEIFEGMTQAGAKVVYNNVVSNMRHAFKDAGKLVPYLKITKPYKTYGGKTVNTKVGFYGYYKTNKPYTNRISRKATQSFTYKTGRGHNSTRIGGRAGGSYSYTQEGVPVPLIVMAREYGTSRGEKKVPFFRKSFNKGAIEKAMLDAQKRLSGGLLDE